MIIAILLVILYNKNYYYSEIQYWVTELMIKCKDISYPLQVHALKEM